MCFFYFVWVFMESPGWFYPWRRIILEEKFSTEDKNGRKKILWGRVFEALLVLKHHYANWNICVHYWKYESIYFSSTFFFFFSPSLVSIVTLLQHLLAQNASVAPTRRRSMARLRPVSSANSNVLLIEKRREEGR